MSKHADETIVLLHSPLVGPTSWSWVARHLSSEGNDVVVPDITAADSFSAAVTLAQQQLPAGRLALVGHSGAGLLLPFLGQGRSVRYVFADAQVPSLSGTVRMSDPEFRAFLETLADDDGWLPPWHRWWDKKVVDAMIPDAQTRRAAVADIPRLPLAYFDHVAEAPDGWADAFCSYLLFSDAYGSVADDAAARGWPVQRLAGTHLELVTAPDQVAESILSLLLAPSG